MKVSARTSGTDRVSTSCRRMSLAEWWDWAGDSCETRSLLLLDQAAA